MTEPRDDSDNGPDFSFLGNDQTPEGSGELDFDDVSQAQDESDAVVPEVPPEVSSTAAVGGVPDRGARRTAEPADTSDHPTAGAVEVTGQAATAVKQDQDPESSETGESDTTATHSSDTERSREVPNSVSDSLRSASMVPQKTFSIVAGYAAALTLLFLLLLVTGRVSLTGTHPLESLPDIAPLQKNEFQQVPADASLPQDHSLEIGQARRFGDVLLTPLRVTVEPLTFTHMSSGQAAGDRQTAPVLKLWFELKNVSEDMAFPPWDIDLMCSRSPAESTDDSTIANSWLMVRDSADSGERRILNYFHPPHSEYDLIGQHSRQVIQPGETMTTFIASSPELFRIPTDTIESYRWRLQLRKGVNRKSGNGVTTLVDVAFTQADLNTSG